MRVVTVTFILVVGQALGLGNIQRRASSDYVAGISRPATGAESSVSDTASPHDAVKYNSPPYVAPTQTQYTTPQQLNYVVQSTYRSLPQPPIAVSYVPQQQKVLYSQQSIYNTQQTPSKTGAIAQKVYRPIHVPAPAPAPYSLAADVSSFKYTSPIVSYSNLGVLQQSVGNVASSAAQDAPTRIQYQPSRASAISSSPVQQQSSNTQPQQLIYRSKLQFEQPRYKPASPASATAEVSAPVSKFVYSQSPQTFATVSRAQPIYQGVAQKPAASALQQLVYTVPQQITYTPVQAPDQVQPVQPGYSIHQPIYVVPQYKLNGAGGQHT